MAVDTTSRKTTLTMTELLTEFDFLFRALVSAPSDIKCIRTTGGADEDMEYVTELPEEPTEADALKYIVEINENGVGGTVTVAYASTSATITIYRETTNKQESVYEDYNQFPAKTVETDFDRRTLIDQEQKEEIDRSLRVPITSDISAELPTPTAEAFIGWNDAGDALENKEIPDPSTLIKATKADAEAGTNNEKFMTPLRAKEAIDALQSDDIPMTYASTDGTLALNSDTKIPTQKAVKTYADGKISKTTAGEIAAMTEKTSLHDDDLFLIEDSQATNAKKKVKKSNVVPVTGFGSWSVALSVSTTYLAATDGFVTCYGTSATDSQPYMEGVTDNNASPATIRIRSGKGNTSQAGQVGLMMPVKKADYWKINVSNVTTTAIYWIPLGG